MPLLLVCESFIKLWQECEMSVVCLSECEIFFVCLSFGIKGSPMGRADSDENTGICWEQNRTRMWNLYQTYARMWNGYHIGQFCDCSQFIDALILLQVCE